MRREDLKQKDIAFALRKHVSWVNKFLLGKRPVHIADLDALADLFGLTAYQLFVPGISERTERRSGKDRRTGKERRKGFPRAMMETRAEVEIVHPRSQALTPDEVALLKNYRRSTSQVKQLTLLAAGAPPTTKRKRMSRKGTADDRPPQTSSDFRYSVDGTDGAERDGGGLSDETTSGDRNGASDAARRSTPAPSGSKPELC